MNFLEREGAPARARIKFCGFTREADVRLACELGADAIGLVFAARSPRRLELEPAAALRALAPPEVSVVALLMDHPAAQVAAVVECLRPDLLQFHGSEEDAFCASFGLPFVKAIAMRGIDGDAVPGLPALYPSAAGWLFDGHAPGAPGGSGERFDWQRLVQQRMDRPWLLAGGLHAGNVAQAIRAARPWGVDVSSGIEAGGTQSAPGVKDPAKMRAFVTAVREAERG